MELSGEELEMQECLNPIAFSKQPSAWLSMGMNAQGTHDKSNKGLSHPELVWCSDLLLKWMELQGPTNRLEGLCNPLHAIPLSSQILPSNHRR